MLSEGWTYVDVRSVAEFDRGHPAGAFNVPLEDLQPALGGLVPNPDFLTAMLLRFGLQARLIVGCQMGIRSTRAAQVLTDAGFLHVVEQHGGWDGTKDRMGRLLEAGWSRRGLPCETAAPTERTWQGVRGVPAHEGAT
jgi:E3 ubiquitin-protein ligase RNF13